MIKSFKCKDTEAIFLGMRSRKFASITTVSERKLQMLEASVCVEDLRVPPGNRLEALKGDRTGYWSIRINDQWRLCFRFDGTDAYDVEIVDYH
jgi:proteic killer suppression protein